jgi:hypothetical protein
MSVSGNMILTWKNNCLSLACQLLLTAGLLMDVIPVYANCENYTDGSVSGLAPRAVLCYREKCDDTILDVECGSVGSGNYAEYASGLIITEKTDEKPVFTNKFGRKMRGEDWTCTQSVQPLWIAANP